MKFFIAKIDERNGEYEYIHVRVLQATSLEQAVACNEETASTWYGGEGATANLATGGWNFNGGAVYVEAGDVVEINEATYTLLNKFL